MSSPTATVQTPKVKRSAKNYLLDKKFQLKYTAYLVILTIAVSGSLGGLLVYQSNKTVQIGNEAVTVGHDASSAGRAAVEQSKSLNTVVEMFAEKYFSDNPKMLADMSASNKEESEKIAKRASDLLASEQKLKAQKDALEQQRKTLLVIVLASLLSLILLVGIAGIVITHKVAGPIYKMKRLLREVGDGKLNVEARLRKGDELQDFFEAFSSMVEKLRDQQQTQINMLESAIAIAKNVEQQELVHKLTSLRNSLQEQLEQKAS